jgi:hypothetical protein
MLLLVPGFMRTLAEHLRAQPSPSLGWGVIAYAGFLFLVLLTLFVMVLGAVVFGLFTLGGLSATIVWVGLLALFALILGFVLATCVLAKIVFGMTLGRWILTSAHSPLAEHRYWPMVIGVGSRSVLRCQTSRWYPASGRVLNPAIVLFGLGTVALAATAASRGLRQPRRLWQPRSTGALADKKRTAYRPFLYLSHPTLNRTVDRMGYLLGKLGAPSNHIPVLFTPTNW